MLVVTAAGAVIRAGTWAMIRTGTGAWPVIITAIAAAFIMVMLVVARVNTACQADGKGDEHQRCGKFSAHEADSHFNEHQMGMRAAGA